MAVGKGLASQIMLRAALLVLSTTASSPAVPPPDTPGPAADASLEWRGRAVCVDDTGARTDCAAEGNRFALQATDGTLHWFAPNDPLSPVFEDVRIREQEVVL